MCLGMAQSSNHYLFFVIEHLFLDKLLVASVQ